MNRREFIAGAAAMAVAPVLPAVALTHAEAAHLAAAIYYGGEHGGAMRDSLDEVLGEIRLFIDETGQKLSERPTKLLIRRSDLSSFRQAQRRMMGYYIGEDGCVRKA